MRVICTGVSGTERREYLAEVAALARERGHGEVPIFDLREAMFEIARDVGEPVEEETILDMFPRALVLLRAAALEKISALCAEARRHHAWIINTHAVFRWRNTLISGFDPHYLTRLQPDLFVTITSGVRTVRERLRQYPRWEDISYSDLLYWREEEQFATEEMARIHRKPQYLLGRQAPPEVLYRLMFQPQMKRAYLSYPMTSVDPTRERGLEPFKARLLERLAVFDPADVDDLVLEDDPEHLHHGGSAQAVGALLSSGHFSDRDLHHISDQIVFRDYKLIAQADMVVVYYDIPVPSPGVVSEMNYALHIGKRVYGVWLPDSDPSPFFTRYCSRVFRGSDELFQYFDRYRIAPLPGAATGRERVTRMKREESLRR
jgi:adenylate kinase